MGCSKVFIFAILIIKTWEAHTITTGRQQRPPVRNFRRHVGQLPIPDWELGLREAVHQALLREHYQDAHLREHITEAPLVGRQNKATPFGDIALLARGQLYHTPEGLKFVQDPYQNDCDDCHNAGNRCGGHPCENLKLHSNQQQLLALWTVKRIRHRDPIYGHVFEIEYTISPISTVINEGFVTRNGYFNYNIPGHVFVIKSDPNLNYYVNQDKNHQSIGGDKYYNRNQGNEQYPTIEDGLPPITQQQQQQNHYNRHFRPGILIGITPDGYKHVLHSFPGFYSSYQPQTTQEQSTIDPKEYELYKKLIESLASKTATPNKDHRFSLGTTSSTSTTTTGKPYKTIYQQTPTFSSLPQTTIYELHDTHQVIPTTEHTIIPLTTVEQHFPTTIPTSTTRILIPLSSPETSKLQPTQTTHANENIQHNSYTTNSGVYNIPSTTTIMKSQIPMTTITYFTPTEEITPSDFKTVPITTTKSTSYRTKKRLTRPSTQSRTTTFRKTTPISDESDATLELFPENTPTKSRIPLTITTKPTTTQTSIITPTYKLEKYDETDLRPNLSNAPTQPTTPITQKPLGRHPESINEQLPPPDKILDTTIPYVLSTVTQPTVAIVTHKQINTDEYGTSTKTDKSKTTQLITKTNTITQPSTTLLHTLPKETTLFQFTTSTTDIPETQSVTNQYNNNYKTTQHENEFSTTLLENTTTIAALETSSGTETSQTTSYQPTTTHFYSFDSELPKTIYYSQPTTSEISTISTITTKHPIYSTTPNRFDDFLINRNNNKKQTNDDINDDDIFGSSKVHLQSTKPSQKEIIVESDFAKKLFGNRKSKQLHSKYTTVEDSPKVIYSNFYEASTELPTKSNLDLFNNLETTTIEYHPLTDQSYSTSITFEVNRRNKNDTIPTTSMIHLEEPTIHAKITELLNQKSDYKIYKAELPEIVENTTTNKQDNKKIFDDLALQLVNHARSIDYINLTKKTQNPKYTRRHYVSKTKRGQVKISQY